MFLCSGIGGQNTDLTFLMAEDSIKEINVIETLIIAVIA